MAGHASQLEAMRFIRLADSVSVTQAAADSYNAGLAAQQSGRLAEAQAHFSAAAEASPAFPHAHTALGDTAADLNHPHDAERHYRRALEVQAGWAGAATPLGFLLMEAGRASEAVPFLAGVAEGAPSSCSARLNLAIALKQAGRLQEAVAAFEQARRIDPLEPKAAYNLGNALFAAGELTRAVEAYRAAAKLAPLHADTHNNMANALREAGDRDGARAALEVALGVDPTSVAALTNLGGIYTETNNFSAALEVLDRAEALAPDLPEVVCSRATALSGAGRREEAMAAFARVVALHPEVPGFRKGFADVLRDAGRDDDAVRELKETVRLEGDGGKAAMLASLAALLRKMGDVDGAVRTYQQALAAGGEDSGIRMNLGVVLADADRTREGIDSLRAAALMAPDNALVLSNLGTVTYTGAVNNLGNALKEQDRFRDALRAWNTALRLEGGRQPDVFANLAHLRMFVADWCYNAAISGKQEQGWSWMPPVRSESIAAITAAGDGAGWGGRGSVAPRTASVQPFHSLLYRDLDQDLVLPLARNFAEAVVASVKHSTRLDTSLFFSAPVTRVRVGYLSHDFGDHPTGHLFNSVPSLHSKADAFYFTLFGAEGSRYWKRLVAAAGDDRVVDVSGEGFEDAAQVVNARQLHVLVDLDVWMKGRRPEILALRPAPVQMVYLGYPGSSGAPYIDHLVSDKVVSPPETRALYSETLVLMPNTYQVNDYRAGFEHVREAVLAAAPGTTRASAGLPAAPQVFLANFNQLYKIDPRQLDLWAEVLARVPAARLWLLRFPALAVRRLVKEGERRGVASHRIILSERLDKLAHLRRVGLADLFLDNHHVNAHTTATEALWAGVPVVTYPGMGMASRVASSLLSAAHVPSLIARDQHDYVALAAALGRSQRARIRVRQAIAARRESSPLLDTQAWVQAWERLLATAVDSALSAPVSRHVREEGGAAGGGCVGACQEVRRGEGAGGGHLIVSST
ncbi:glycosyl transferase family 41-domain-containing protein [Baffinella frigidus]|nr:glycosyl transferase family 41-domain-containing protein [Cryptophyta sp. CCMP2293]